MPGLRQRINRNRMFLVVQAGILPSRSCKIRSSRLPVALSFYGSFHTHKNTGKRRLALFLFFCARIEGR
jgi:hypothetical protein